MSVLFFGCCLFFILKERCLEGGEVGEDLEGVEKVKRISAKYVE